MPSSVTRRRLLRASPAALVGFAGCLSGDADPPATQTQTTAESGPDTDSESESETGTTTSDSRDSNAGLGLVELAVSDFLLYALAGTHPHVHRRAETQYVVARVAAEGTDDDAVRDRLSLELDGTTMPLADRRPVPWENQTTDVAFAVPKGETYESGTLRAGETTLRSLSTGTLDRLNHPPRFRVSDVSASPDEIPAGEETTATVRATVENAGEGAGTFGASLKGNYVSGANTLTLTLDAGSGVELTASTPMVGEGDEAPLRLDWGSGQWSTAIPVVEATTTNGTETEATTTDGTDAATDGTETETETPKPK